MLPLAWLGAKPVQEAPAPADACVFCTAGAMLCATMQDVAAGLLQAGLLQVQCDAKQQGCMSGTRPVLVASIFWLTLDCE